MKRLSDVIQPLREKGISCQLQVSMMDFTTFRLGGLCPLLMHATTPSELQIAITLLHQYALPFILIGGGSNLLVSDHGVDQVVIRYVKDEPDIVIAPHETGAEVTVSGATSFDALALACCRAGLGQLALASGIPGTVGGAVVGNAGAFGWQIADALERVTTVDITGKMQEEHPETIGFSYRDSGLKGSDRYVASVTLRLPLEDQRDLLAKRDEILELRHQKHPDLETDPCAGSFFRNIEPTSKAERRQAAGHFLEEAGAKAMQEGGAGVFPRHANIIVKQTPACKAQDVYTLSKRMARAVQEKFDLSLIREVQALGHFDQPEL